ALESGHLRGAVLDVYGSEPLAADSPLRRAPNVLLMPHMGASTAEAQRNVAVDVCIAVRDALLRGELSRSINVAGMHGAVWADLQPAMQLTERMSAICRALLADQGARAIRRLALRVGGELAGAREALLAAAAIGVLGDVIETERLNLINARALAEQRGIELAVTESPAAESPRAIELSMSSGMKELYVAGVAPDQSAPRLTRIGSFHVDVNPRQTLLILTNHDVPGVIGRVGTLLGEAKVNIAEYHQARLAQGGEALAAVTVDGQVGEVLRQQLLALPDVISATIANFRA
nr:hypothetical protein [Gemmatimonadaceae bacterium]